MDVGMKKNIFVLVCLFTVITSAGELITVDDDGPANFNTIQAAMDYAWDGDTIMVEPGAYYENIHFNNKAVTLTGTNPDDPNIVSSTIITANTGYSVSFDSNEADNSVLTGFTITGRGIYCYSGTAPTISRNIIKDCGTWGIYGQQNVIGEYKAAPVILENKIINSQGGIAYCNGPITNNVISENVFNVPQTLGGGGLSFCDGVISGNMISYNHSGYEGGGCFVCNGDIANNTFIGNSSVDAGGALSECNGNIHNNIITGNSSDTSGGGLYGCSNIYNNTILGNLAGDKGGALSQCSEDVKNNIIMLNRAHTTGGIDGGQINNSYNCYWQNQGGNVGGGAVFGITDFVDDPQFAVNGYWETNGTPSEYSDDVWIDGDYHFKSEAGRWDPDAQSWVQDDVTSSCIDAGDPNTVLIAEFWPHGNRVNVGAYGNTAQASWSLSDVGNIADLNYDGWVDNEDMKLLTGKWLRHEVLLAEDLDRDGKVDLADLTILLANWHQRPPAPKPPTPDPMTWEMEPSVVSSTALVMVATTATSTDDSGVEYYFQCDTPGGHDSGWQNTPGYTDAGLTPSTEYFYRVKARNRANLVETEFSPARSATTASEDNTPPNPNPAQWQTQPYPVPPSSIRMVAATASDPSGVEYYFQCTTNPLYSSTWQSSPEYIATSLPKGTYSFVVRVRDKSPKHNTTADSASVSVDLQPPTPDPMRWATGGEPAQVYRGGGALVGYWAVMTAAEATDTSGTVEYYFECTTASGFSSGWQSSPTYEVQIGRKDQYQQFRVKARDIYGNETAFSPVLPAI